MTETLKQLEQLVDQVKTLEGVPALMKQATDEILKLREEKGIALRALDDLAATCAYVSASYANGSLGNAIDKLTARADIARAVSLKLHGA